MSTLKQNVSTAGGFGIPSTGIAKAPQQLYALLGGPKKKLADKHSKTESSGNMLPKLGSRNNTLTSLAGSLVHKRFPKEVVEKGLLAVNGEFSEPLPEDEVKRIANSVSRYEPGIEITEQDLSNYFADNLAHVLRYVPGDGWRNYTGKAWQRDIDDLFVQERSKELVATLRISVGSSDKLDGEAKSKLMKSLARMQKLTPIRNIISLARSHEALIDIVSWDEPANVVNFQNGTLHLPDLKLRAHDPADRLTRILPYDYDPVARCPTFDDVLLDALGDEEAQFLLQMFGYALTGQGGLQKMLWLTGKGQNGKSTLVEAMSSAMRCYSAAADPKSFEKSHFDNGINNDIARLHGARLVTISEWTAGRQLDEALIKRMLGDELLTARFLYRENFEFLFNGLVSFNVNSPPVFQGNDFATARRLLVLNFPNIVDEAKRDTQLPAKLKAEAAGIMNRLLQGAVKFLTNGLVVPASVRADTDALVYGADPVRQFIDDRCELQGSIGAADLYLNYRVWAIEMGLKPMPMPAFKAAVSNIAGVYQTRSRKGLMWKGISVGQAVA